MILTINFITVSHQLPSTCFIVNINSIAVNIYTSSFYFPFTRVLFVGSTNSLVMTFCSPMF